jgi:hypothetical protein
MADSSTTSNQNKNYVTNDGKSSTFGRGLMSYLQNKLPYSNIVDTENNELNPKYKDFANIGLRRSEALSKHSVSISNEYNNMPIGSMGKDTSFGQVMYANIQENKGARMRDYRVMAAYSDVADALDEICDEAINTDENGNEVNVKYKNIDLSGLDKTILDEEFSKFANYFDFKNRGWQYFRQFLVEGELFFELIVHKDYLNEGVLGVVNLPPELIDPVYNNIQNMMVKGFIYKKPIFDPTRPDKQEKIEFIPLDENQVVYINSGVMNETKNMVLPFLENARRAYRQLSLIEDAIVIYRLVRAPERLVFNVDVGNMPAPKAEAYLKKLISNYWSSKTFDIDQADVVKKFNPQSMLDAFWFPKRTGSEGSSVSQLAGGQNLGELADLMYFIKKLYRSLKVPTSRLDPEDAFRDGTEILREELKFARFIIRQQQRFADGIKKGFVTHLKFKGLWEKLELNEQNIDVMFNVPTNFYEMRESQRLEQKANNFNSIASSEFVSKTYAQKKYLGWRDKDILANREFLRKDAELQWELQQISSLGPAWREQVIAQDISGGETPSEEFGGGGELGGGAGPGGTPPPFGGGAAEAGPAPEAEAGAPEEAGTPPEAPTPAA